MAKVQLAMLHAPDKRIAERRIVNLVAQLRGLGAWFVEVELLDLSTDGFKVEIDQALERGAYGWLKLPGLPPVNCRVAWSADGAAGFTFTTPLHPANVEIAIAAGRKPLRKSHFGPRPGRDEPK
jgi:hypothetical protein